MPPLPLVDPSLSIPLAATTAARALGATPFDRSVHVESSVGGWIRVATARDGALNGPAFVLNASSSFRLARGTELWAYNTDVNARTLYLLQRALGPGE